MAARERKRRITSVQVTAQVEAAEAKRAPWYLAAPAGGVLVAVAGWFLVAGATVIGWLAQPTSSFGSALKMGTQLWLLANGGGVEAGGVALTVVPLGLTAVLVLLATGVVGYAIQQAASGEDAGRSAPRAAAVFTATYVACVLAASLLTSAHLIGRAFIGSALIAGGSALWMLVKHTDLTIMSRVPEWARIVPKAMAAALLVLVIGAGIVLTTALLQNRDRVVALHDSLNPGIAGGLLLLVVQLAYLPNVIAWCASWVLGAGFAIGQGSVIAPSQTDVGLLPALPLFGAIPEPGPGTWAMLWWLVIGVVAGAVASVVVVLARPRARFDETALVGGLSGVLAGLLLVALVALTNGGFGVGRLSEVGARVGSLAVLAPTLLGLSGVVAGLVIGLVRRPERDATAATEASTDAPEAEDTTVNPERQVEELDTERL